MKMFLFTKAFSFWAIPWKMSLIRLLDERWTLVRKIPNVQSNIFLKAKDKRSLFYGPSFQKSTHVVFTEVFKLKVFWWLSHPWQHFFLNFVSLNFLNLIPDCIVVTNKHWFKQICWVYHWVTSQLTEFFHKSNLSQAPCPFFVPPVTIL